MMRRDDPKNILGIDIVADPGMPQDQLMIVNVDVAHRRCPACRQLVPLRAFTDLVNMIVRDICAACREKDARKIELPPRKPYGFNVS